ncbi:MAG: hypothetical protein LH654_01420 [Thermoleophilia bacterium]|nr:hypothetical protein [Thermoleophilia bacterium]
MSLAELERPVLRLTRLDHGDRRLRTLDPLVVDDGCDVRIRGRYCADCVRVALLEWLPLTCDDLLSHRGSLVSDPAAVLSALVRPPTIWTTADAVVAARRGDGESETRRERHDAVVAYAFTQLREEHLERLRCIAARFARQMSLEGRPGTCDALAAGCAVVAGDDDACAAVAAIQLARYAASAFVARRRRMLHLP